jgi:hypothetical protein
MIEFKDGDNIYAAESTDENPIVQFKRMDGIWWSPTNLTDKMLEKAIDKRRYYESIK